jgi:hypothetical protein
MQTHNIIDSNGTIVKTVLVPTQEMLELNTPPGMIAVPAPEGETGFNYEYDLVTEEYVSIPPIEP